MMKLCRDKSLTFWDVLVPDLIKMKTSFTATNTMFY